MSCSDYQMALLLQQQFEHEATVDNPTHNLVYANKKSKCAQNPVKSLTDASWELIDPTPNIHMLFMAFNEKYFWNKLMAVCVDWSKRMTTCAGICSYQGRGGLCRITLSEPLLKLRPRKDLVETLLHEMIHAYLFVSHNNRDRDGHGPEFHKHMYRINAEAGTNITVYHDFHDEVRLYQQHWWRCNGPCQHWKPYFGMVRRATNRAPGPNDRWWAEHQRNCGGNFVKVKEPEKQPKKKSQKENKAVISPKNDIRNFYPVVKGKSFDSPSSSAVNTNNKPCLKTSNINGFGNVLSSTGSTNVSTSANTVVGFKDLNSAKTKNALSNSSSTIVINKKPATAAKQNSEDIDKPKFTLVQAKSTSVSAFTGTGQSLGGQKSNDHSDYAAVRNHWVNKFANNSQTDIPTAVKRVSSGSLPGNGKKARPHTASVNGIANNDPVIIEKINLDSVKCPVCQKEVLSSEVNAHLDQCLENQPVDLPRGGISQCPVCEEQVDVCSFEAHVAVCVDEVFSDSKEPSETKSTCDFIPCLVCSKQIPKDGLNTHLDECMGDNIFSNDSNFCTDDDPAVDSKDKDEEKKYNCPVCFKQFHIKEMSGHLDVCLVNDNQTCNGDENSVLNSLLDNSF